MKDPEKLVEAFKEAGALLITQPDWKGTGLYLSAVLPPESLIQCTQKLLQESYTLLDISTAEFTEGFLVTYHFDSFLSPGRLALRVLITDKINPTVPSIYPVYQGAEWHERESHDFFGVIFTGNPNLVPLLLPHDLPGPPPLRKNPENLASLFKLNFLGEIKFSAPSWGA
ncbi:MAG: NADH-quinone oxidoreductase subunit C [Deltaproteobacteria bacterium]|jgi:NADH-quinone oxidoreductase subunit C|nr:NADH-quinone oxidoreductase subunit C [Deltaproteobacteria bacterium]